MPGILSTSFVRPGVTVPRFSLFRERARRLRTWLNCQLTGAADLVYGPHTATWNVDVCRVTALTMIDELAFFDPTERCHCSVVVGQAVCLLPRSAAGVFTVVMQI